MINMSNCSKMQSYENSVLTEDGVEMTGSYDDMITNREHTAVPAPQSGVMNTQRMMDGVGSMGGEMLPSGAMSGVVSDRADPTAGMTPGERTYYNSWKGMMSRNLGRHVIVSFLIGTQNTIIARGVLYEVGNDYIILYRASDRSYITADLYAVKFMEFLPETGIGLQ